MGIIVAFVFVAINVGVFAQSSEELICKAREGCHLATCDPSPSMLFLDRNEYPITCIKSFAPAFKAENVDVMERLQSTVKELSSVKSELKKLSAELTKIKSEESAPTTPNCLGGLLYFRKCYIMPYLTSSDYVQQSRAVKACQAIGAELAEIKNTDHQRALEEYVRTVIPQRFERSYQLWVGMEYNEKTKTVRYKDGREVPMNTFRWEETDGPHNFISLDAGKHKGLMRQNPNYVLLGVICMKEL